MLRIVCPGYFDAKAVRHHCGKVLGTRLSPNTGVAATFCDDCHAKAMEAIEQRHQERLADKGLCLRCARAALQVTADPDCPAPLCRFCHRQLSNLFQRDQDHQLWMDARRRFYQGRETDG